MSEGNEDDDSCDCGDDSDDVAVAGVVVVLIVGVVGVGDFVGGDDNAVGVIVPVVAARVKALARWWRLRTIKPTETPVRSANMRAA